MMIILSILMAAGYILLGCITAGLLVKTGALDWTFKAERDMAKATVLFWPVTLSIVIMTGLGYLLVKAGDPYSWLVRKIGGIEK